LRCQVRNCNVTFHKQCCQLSGPISEDIGYLICRKHYYARHKYYDPPSTWVIIDPDYNLALPWRTRVTEKSAGSWYIGGAEVWLRCKCYAITQYIMCARLSSRGMCRMWNQILYRYLRRRENCRPHIVCEFRYGVLQSTHDIFAASSYRMWIQIRCATIDTQTLRLRVCEFRYDAGGCW